MENVIFTTKTEEQSAAKFFSKEKRTMYAVTFDLDTTKLQQFYLAMTGSPSYNNAYSAIGQFLMAQGFQWTQGSVYFGGPTIDAVKCVIAVQKLSATYPWFKPSIRDIRMLRIEDNNDLMPAI